jgi:hypothetical protein
MSSEWADEEESELVVVALVLAHGGDEGVAVGGAKWVGLQSVLADDAFAFGVEPGVSEEAGAQLVGLIEGSLVLNDRAVVPAVETVLRRLEEALFFLRKTKVYVAWGVLLPCRERSRNCTLNLSLLWGKL